MYVDRQHWPRALAKTFASTSLSKCGYLDRNLYQKARHAARAGCLAWVGNARTCSPGGRQFSIVKSLLHLSHNQTTFLLTTGLSADVSSITTSMAWRLPPRKYSDSVLHRTFAHFMTSHPENRGELIRRPPHRRPFVFRRSRHGS